MDSVAIQWQYQPERIDCYILETNHHLFNKETMELPGSLDKVQSFKLYLDWNSIHKIFHFFHSDSHFFSHKSQTYYPTKTQKKSDHFFQFQLQSKFPNIFASFKTLNKWVL